MRRYRGLCTDFLAFDLLPGDYLMKVLRPVIASNGVPYLQMSLV